ncbi:MAG TPA: hypothetical protein VL551_10920 [Actinospica sp.]|nr:hypothetical protein [Actinospica sp.]
MRIPRVRRRREDERPRRRSFNALWAFFWLILIIILLGLIFGGYRKGTPVNNPGTWISTGISVLTDVRGAAQ